MNFYQRGERTTLILAVWRLLFVPCSEKNGESATNSVSKGVNKLACNSFCGGKLVWNHSVGDWLYPRKDLPGPSNGLWRIYAAMYIRLKVTLSHITSDHCGVKFVYSKMALIGCRRILLHAEVFFWSVLVSQILNIKKKVCPFFVHNHTQYISVFRAMWQHTAIAWDTMSTQP